MQRLAQIVARRGEEARLGEVGEFELLGALIDLALERRIGVLKLGGQSIHIDSFFGEIGQRPLAVAPICREHLDRFGIGGERLQCFIRHRIDREGRCQRFGIQGFRSGGILRSGAAPQ